MTAETVLILPTGSVPATAAAAETPFGRAPVGELEGLPVLLREEGVEARALIYAAKAMGARRVLAAEAVQPVSPLLEPGDLVVPLDVIDLTKLRPFTFFVGKGYGFIKLNPPFCPDLMGALLREARLKTARSFRSAIYIGAEGPRDATAAELRMFRQWGGDIVGSALLPEAYLARELELHYAALTVVGATIDGLGGVLSAVGATADGLGPVLSAVGATADGLGPVLSAVARRPDLGALAPCGCAETMKFMQQQGVVGEDWKTWLA